MRPGFKRGLRAFTPKPTFWKHRRKVERWTLWTRLAFRTSSHRTSRCPCAFLMSCFLLEFIFMMFWRVSFGRRPRVSHPGTFVGETTEVVAKAPQRRRRYTPSARAC